MSDTGGGHRASAEALCHGFVEKYGERVQVSTVDPWIHYAPWPLNQLPKLYPLIVQKVPWLWILLWRITHYSVVATPLVGCVAMWARKAVERTVREHRPDLIIHVHPVVQAIFARLMPSLQQQIPSITIVTDLTHPHPLWFYGQTEHCFVPTEDVYMDALNAGLKEEQLTVGGLPVHSKYVKGIQSQARLWQRLNLSPKLPMVLLIGGGDGVGALPAIAQAVSSALEGEKPIGQLVIICGHNRTLYAKLQAEEWPIPTRICSFEPNLHEWMVLCDCMITKAGPGTIAEAQVLGVPLIISGFIPGQETGNVGYVLEHGMGLFCAAPKEIGQIVRRWFTTAPDELRIMRENAERLRTLNATEEIVDTIEELGLLRF